MMSLTRSSLSLFKKDSRWRLVNVAGVVFGSRVSGASKYRSYHRTNYFICALRLRGMGMQLALN